MDTKIIEEDGESEFDRDIDEDEIEKENVGKRGSSS